MSDRDSQQQGQGQRSAFSGTQVNYAFPISQLDTLSRDLKGFTLVAEDGRIWTSAPDGKQAHQMLTKAVENVQPQGVTT